jgi:hypothetical protein
VGLVMGVSLAERAGYYAGGRLPDVSIVNRFRHCAGLPRPNERRGWAAPAARVAMDRCKGDSSEVTSLNLFGADQCFTSLAMSRFAPLRFIYCVYIADSLGSRSTSTPE